MSYIVIPDDGSAVVRDRSADKPDLLRYAAGFADVHAQLLLYDAQAAQQLYAIADELLRRWQRVAELEQADATVDLADAAMALGWVQARINAAHDAVCAK